MVSLRISWWAVLLPVADSAICVVERPSLVHEHHAHATTQWWRKAESRMVLLQSVVQGPEPQPEGVSMLWLEEDVRIRCAALSSSHISGAEGRSLFFR